MKKKILSLLLTPLFILCSCSPDPETKEWTHTIEGEGVSYYKGGPQQSSPPDGTIISGTKVKIITDSGSYSEIESATGVKGFVSSAYLKPIP